MRENRATPVLDVVACGHRNAAMTQGFAGGQQSVTGMDVGVPGVIDVLDGLLFQSQALSRAAFREQLIFRRVRQAH